MLNLSSVVISAFYSVFLLIRNKLWLCWVVVRAALFDSVAVSCKGVPLALSAAILPGG